MKKINYPLLIGGIIFIFFMAMAMFPEHFTEKDPMYEDTHRNMEVMVDGEIREVFTMHPIWPSEYNLMGSDVAGRDIHARLVYGTRNTLRLGFFIALFRLILAVPVGILAGIGKKFFNKIILFFNTYFSAVPILILSFMIFRINFFRNLQIERAILVYAVILALLGWSRAAGVIEDAVKVIMEEDFIEGQIAIGKSWPQIVRQNIIPHVMPTALSSFFKEAGQGLFLLAQLAVLGIFVGSTREVRTLASRASYEMSIEPEWGSMLMKLTTQMERFTDNWWLVVFPVLTFALAVLGLNLLGEGLRIEFAKRNSRFVSNVRKAYYILSPGVIYLEIRHFRKYWKNILLRAGAVATLILVVFVPRYQPVGNFSLENAKNHLITLTSEEYDGRVSGSAGGYKAGEYITETMEGLGFKTKSFPIKYAYENQIPGDPREAVLEFSTPLIMKEGKITLKDDKGDVSTYTLHEDFSILEVPMERNLPGASVVISGKTVLGKDLETQEGEANLIPVNYTGINDIVSGSINYPGFATDSDHAEFLIIDGHESRSNAHSSFRLIILPFDELRDKLETASFDVTIEYTVPDYPVNEGRIIEAWLLPEGKTMENPGQTLIISSVYDGLWLPGGKSSVEGTTPVATALEIARAITEDGMRYNKSILFLFHDRESELLAGNFSEYFMRHAEISASGGYMYLDLMGSGLKGDRTVDLVSYFGQMDKEQSFRSLLKMEGILKDMKVPYTRYQGLLPTEETLKSLPVYKIASRQLLSFRANAHLAVGIGKAYHNRKGTKADTLENLNEKKLESIGQMLVDMIITKENFKLGED